MTAPTVFDFEEHPIRMIAIDGAPWWVAMDVCRALGFAKGSKPTRALDPDEKGVHISHTLGGAQEVAIVNEPGLYRLIFTARVAAADRFKRWLAHEVLPQIRAHGRFAFAPDPTAQVDLRSEEIDAALRIVREARLVFGRAAARHIWARSPLADLLPDAIDGPLNALDRAVIEAVLADYVVTGKREDMQSSQELIQATQAVLRAQGVPGGSDRAVARALVRCLHGYRDPVTGAEVCRIKSSSTFYRGLALRPAFTLS